MKLSLENNLLLQKIQKVIPFVDLALAEHLIKNYHASEDALPFLVHLSQATRAGHLCIKVDELEVLPKPEKVWEIAEQQLISEEEWKHLETLIFKSAQNLSSSLLTTILSQEEIPSTPISRFGNLFYFQKYWLYERDCLIKFYQMQNESPSLSLNSSQVQSSLDELLSEGNLLPEQAYAIKQFEHQALTLISGGPGTGKTYTAGLLIKVFWNSISNEQRTKCRIALAAPTGKAAATLQKSLQKAIGNLPDFRPITASTLHHLLSIKPNFSAQNPLIGADLVIVDECSMIDIRMMSILLKALKPGSRLILLGDPNQLPPIGAGAFFADMLKYSKHSTHLTQCLRTDLAEIVHVSEEIKNGRCQAALQVLKTSKNLEFYSLPEDQNPDKFRHQLWEKACPYLFNSLKAESLENFNRFRILSPLRKGPWGVDQLNHFFYREVLKQCRNQEQILIPIMIKANAPKLELYNGDVGLLVRKKTLETESLQVGDYALFGGKKIPALLLPKFEYSYCMSVHKSQGCEFDHVILLLPEGSERFGRELVYTGVTRAQFSLEIWSQPLIFEKILNHSSFRLSQSLIH